MVCSIQLKSDDDTFNWVIKFMQEKGFLGKDISLLKAAVKKEKRNWWEFKPEDEKKKPEIEYLPGPGTHLFTFNGKKMWAFQKEGEMLVTGWERKPTKHEYLTIFTYGKSTKPIQDLIDYAVEHSMEKNNDTIGIYELHRWGIGWTKVQSKKPRQPDSVVLDQNMSEEIISDIQKF